MPPAGTSMRVAGLASSSALPAHAIVAPTTGLATAAPRIARDRFARRRRARVIGASMPGARARSASRAGVGRRGRRKISAQIPRKSACAPRNRGGRRPPRNRLARAGWAARARAATPSRRREQIAHARAAMRWDHLK
jgi:hypothetical protein